MSKSLDQIEQNAEGRPLRVLYLMAFTDRAESESIIAMAQRGVRPTVICSPDAGMRERMEQAGVEVIPLPLRANVDRDSIAAMRALLQEREFDLVHALYKKTLCNFTLAARGLRRPPMVAYRGIIGNLSYWDPLSWLSFLNPRIERIICVCEAIRQYFLHKRFLLGFHLFKPQRVVTIYKGHRPEWYRGSADRSALRALGIADEAPVIGCVARLKKRKGIVELIQAFEQLPGELNAHLVLVGTVEYPAIEAAARNSSAAERIHLLGFRRDAPALAGAFDIITLPSLRREGLPRAIIEAMAQGVPAMVSDSGGNPELVEDGKSGRVTPAGDVAAMREALRQMVADRELRARLGEGAARRIAEDFSIERTVEKTLALYQEVLAEAKP